jgi:pimeloyl-ACP methyl ester carboxylesterase
MPIASLNGVDLNYKTSGEGDWLVMIGGYMSGNIEAWGGQSARLARSYRVLNFDNRGLGHSSAPDVPYTTRMMARDTAALMKHLGIAKAHILGKSLGGAIGQWIAIDEPDLVRSLAMTSTFRLLSARAKNMVRWWLHTASLAGRVTRELYSGMYTYFLTEAYYEANIAAVEATIDAGMGVNRPVHGFVNTGNCLLTHDTMDLLQRIACPTQILIGADDIITTADHSRVLASRIPGAELQVIPNSLHGFMTEAPSSFELIEKFFARN